MPRQCAVFAFRERFDRQNRYAEPWVLFLELWERSRIAFGIDGIGNNRKLKPTNRATGGSEGFFKQTVTD